LGNERADELANKARESGIPPAPDPLLQGEEQVFFWSEESHVIGDLRAEVKRQMEKRNLEAWKQQEHQGRVARRVGPAALAHAKTIRRFAWLCRAPEMLVFFLQAMCEWLPTRGRDSHSATTFEDRTCLWCSNQAVDDSRHALSCSANKNAADNRWDEVQNLLRGTVSPDVFRRPCIGGDLASRLVRRAERRHL
jgi:hypothetical protein